MRAREHVRNESALESYRERGDVLDCNKEEHEASSDQSGIDDDGIWNTRVWGESRGTREVVLIDLVNEV